MTDQSTVYFGADRVDVQASITEMVAIQIRRVIPCLDAIRVLCESERHCSYGPPKCPTCTGIDVFAAKVRALLPDLPVSGSQREGVTPMASGTRVTRGEDDRDLSVGGSDTGN